MQPLSHGDDCQGCGAQFWIKSLLVVIKWCHLKGKHLLFNFPGDGVGRNTWLTHPSIDEVANILGFTLPETITG